MFVSFLNLLDRRRLLCDPRFEVRTEVAAMHFVQRLLYEVHVLDPFSQFLWHAPQIFTPHADGLANNFLPTLAALVNTHGAGFFAGDGLGRSERNAGSLPGP